MKWFKTNKGGYRLVKKSPEEKKQSKDPKKEEVELEESLLNKDGKPSMGKLKSAIDDVNNTKSMAGDKFGITNIDYREKNGKKFLDVEVEDGKGLLKALQRKYGKSVKLRGYSDFYIESVNEELEEATFSPSMITQLKKQYEPLRGKRIAPEPLMKIFDKIDSNKDALITLFKADIPFVSQLAVSRLISKHNMKGAEINKLKEEVEDNIQEARLPSFKDLVKYKYGDDHAGAIHFSKIGGKEYHWNYVGRKGGKYFVDNKPTPEIRVSRAGADSKINKIVKEEVELTEYFATVHSDKKPIVDFVKKYARTPSTQASIDYVDDDAGGNIEFEGRGAHDLADKVKAKFGVRVTKESFEPIENKSLEELTANDPMSKSYLYLTKPMTVQYTYMRNPQLFMQTLKGTKTGKALKHVFPRKMGSDEYILKGTGQQHIEFLKTLNSKGIMPKNKIIGEELEEDTNKYITEKIKGLENKADKTGMPYGILKKVYDRGMAAWKGGHRPGAGQQQWAFARVNSFVTKSSGTWGKADADLAKQVRASESIEESRQLKDKETEMLVSLDGKVKVIDKSEWDKYKSKGYIQAEDKEEENEACWDSHKQVGTKMKGGKTVPNCVPKNEEINIGGYDGARNLVDRLLNKRGDK